ncbi:MAG TPA: hypothetical protein VFV50_07205 [Bdellovibrionales bacterium]|nr:hypothetical protein [Bdellovibrionales bacterium]
MPVLVSLGALIISLLLLCAQLAQGAEISGRAFTDVYLPAQKKLPKPLNQLSGSVWLQGDQAFSEAWSARAIFEANAFDYNNSNVSGRGDSTHVEATLREGYVSYFSEGLELKAGRMILPWGKSDGINPTDFLSARNYSFFNPDSEVQRVGGAAVQLSYTPESLAAWNFTAVVQPYFPQGRFLIAPGVLPSGITLNEPGRPEAGNPKNFEVALRASYAGEGWDASLSGFNGWNHFPELAERMHTVLGPGLVAVELDQTNRRVRAVGADGSYNQGKYVYRAESAYFWTENEDGLDMRTQPMHHDTVIGVERPFGDHVRMQVQGVLRYYPNWRPIGETGGADPVSAEVNRQVASSNALLFQYQSRVNTSATFRIAYTDEASGVDAELFATENFEGQDFLVRPKVSYAATDQLRYTLGGDFYGGPGHRTLGALNPYNSVFLEAKYTF